MSELLPAETEFVSPRRLTRPRERRNVSADLPLQPNRDFATVAQAGGPGKSGRSCRGREEEWVKRFPLATTIVRQDEELVVAVALPLKDGQNEVLGKLKFPNPQATAPKPRGPPQRPQRVAATPVRPAGFTASKPAKNGTSVMESTIAKFRA